MLGTIAFLALSFEQPSTSSPEVIRHEHFIQDDLVFAI